MALYGVSLMETQDYVSTHDSNKTEAEGATVFVLGTLDLGMRMKLLDNAFDMVQGGEGPARININRNTVNMDAVKYGLKGWRNFRDRSGEKEIPFTTETETLGGKPYTVVSKECMNLLPTNVLLELGQKIMDINSVDAGFAGNSPQA